MKRLFVMIMLLLLIPAGCIGENGAPPKRAITNIDGTQIDVPLSAQRLAAVYGPSYEALVVLGAEEKIVVCADVQFENFPWARKIYKHISETPYLVNVHTAVSKETLLQYEPDLVFSFARPNELRQLAASGIAAIPAVAGDNLDNVKGYLLVYGEALGGEHLEAAKRYEQYFDQKRAVIKTITREIPVEERPKVYYSGIDILTTYGMYSDICQLIDEAGGIAVTAELPAGNRTQINLEQLAAWNPDHIFIDHGGINDKAGAEEIMSSTYTNKQFQAITAVTENNIHLSPSGVFYWDMGLQKILLLMYMAKTIHPDYFAELDMTEEVMEFYQTFFDYPLTREEAEKILQRQDP